MMFHHGWPLSADDWDNQMMYFLERGFRVVAPDIRGHGRSSQTHYGNEMDTYAAMSMICPEDRAQGRCAYRAFHWRWRSGALCGEIW